MTVNIGDKAPDFELPASSDTTVRLSDFKGKNVILYFYPKDDTSGCTQEACDFRDNIQTFENINAVVLGISKDSVKSHNNFIDKYDLPFVLLSDVEGQVCVQYGTWVEKSMYGRKYMGIERTTFLINPEGVVLEKWSQVKVPGHVQNVLDSLNRR
jgi:peroxiredoxin Q/BCP